MVSDRYEDSRDPQSRAVTVPSIVAGGNDHASADEPATP